MRPEEKNVQPVGNGFARAFLELADRVPPLDPKNNSLGEEISIEDYLNPDKEPAPVPCPHCGAMLPAEKLLDKNGSFITWNPLRTCKNPECARLTEERDLQLAEENRRIKAALKAREEAERLEKHIDGSGISRRSARCTFAGYRPLNAAQKIAKDTCVNYAKNIREHITLPEEGIEGDGQGLYIYGPYGTGKTHLVSAMCMDILRANYGLVMRTDCTLLANIRAAFDDRSRSENITTNIFARTNLLVIDDFGKSNISEWAMTKLYEIINTRYEECRPTVISTNYAPEELAERLGAGSATNLDRARAICSRLRETTQPVPLTGMDYRLKKLA